MIPFNIPYVTGEEIECITEAIQKKNLSGEGFYTRSCQEQLQNLTKAKRVLLTPSCTHALELSALLLDLNPGDEIIMPSFTFVSTANAFVLRGAIPVFVDIRPDTMNIDENLIEAAITPKTKAIVVMHYAGISCEMEKIMALANKKGIVVIEDAAQCIGAFYKGKHLGTIGHLGSFSFHSTKNIHCGEGGAFLINEEDYILRSEIIREKGTNRNQFLRGEIDKYSWVDLGSSILLGELSAAFLFAQLKNMERINTRRVEIWNLYQEALKDYSEYFDLPFVPEYCEHNGHIFYIKCKDKSERQSLIDYLKKKGIASAFHYVPLHSAKGGITFSRFFGEDRYTTVESERLLRLPLYFDLDKTLEISEALINFYKA